MTTARLDLLGDNAVKRGIAYELTLDLKQPNGQPVNLTGCSAIAQVRRQVEDEKALSWSVGINQPTSGRIVLTMPGQQSRSEDFPAGRYVWDMVVTFADGSQRVPVSGSIELKDVVSRAGTN